MTKKKGVVPSELEGRRLDQVLVSLFPDVSRRAARKLIDLGAVFVDGKRCRVAGRLLGKGGLLEMDLTPLSWGASGEDRLEALCAAVRIVDTTKDMVIVEKPAGLHTQGTSAGDRYTLLRAVADGLGKRPQDLHLVHRLDQVTGGLLVIALSRERAAELSDSLRDHEIERGYVALVHGEWEGEVLVDQPIKHKSGAQVPAVTRMRATRFDSESSLVWAALKTGRTHQVRIHAAAQGHPVIGDAKYGSAVRLPHIALHAAYLRMGDDRWISQPPLDGPWSQWSKRPAQEEWAETFEKLYERGWAD